MSCCGHQWKNKIKEKCTRHTKQQYEFFCTNQNCLQILCKQCVKEHQAAHISTSKGDPEIVGLGEVEAFFEDKAEREVQYEENLSKPKFMKDIDPCQIVCQRIDEYFYGNLDNKLHNERARRESMRSPNAIKLIEIIQKQSEYRLPSGFRTRYFALLDTLLSD